MQVLPSWQTPAKCCQEGLSRNSYSKVMVKSPITNGKLRASQLSSNLDSTTASAAIVTSSSRHLIECHNHLPFVPCISVLQTGALKLRVLASSSSPSRGRILCPLVNSIAHPGDRVRCMPLAAPPIQSWAFESSILISTASSSPIDDLGRGPSPFNEHFPSRTTTPSHQWGSYRE